MEAQGMNIECRTLLFQMLKNRPEGMSRESAIESLSIPDSDPAIETIRFSLLSELVEMDNQTYFHACKNSALHHFEEEENER